MIVYYDILLLDGRSLLDVRHSERFKLLEELVRCDRGQAELIQRQIINTNHPMAASALRNAFAKVITDRSEGLVLKADQPYFNFHNHERPFTNHCIKLKKDYIGRFGEVGDFAVVGAGFSASKARSYNIDNLKWTHFYVGCIDNREQVKRWDATPEFTVINVVELNEAMLKTFMSCTNPKPIPVEGNVETKLIFAAGAQTVPMTVAFTDPPVFDMRCFSFDKAGNTDWWSLRFPSVAKIHFDRDYSDVLSFDELQKIADSATAAPELEDSQDNLAWIAKLEQADPRGLAVDAATQLTATTMQTPSPRRTSHNSSASQPLIRHVGEGSLERSIELLGTPVPEPQKVAATQPPPTVKPLKISLLPNDKRKRPVSPPIFFSPSKRHREVSINETPRRDTSSHMPRSESPARRALGEINGNSVQVPHVPASHPTDRPPKSQNQHFSNPSMGNLEKGKSNHDASTESLSSSPSLHDSAIVIPDSEDEDDDTDDNERFEDQEYPNQDVEKAEISCQYARSKCQLANRLILLPSYLSDIEELDPLLRAHGISNVVSDAEAWVKENAANIALSPDGQTGPNTILFVDSVDKEPDTKALLFTLEDIREAILEERREWISVFDWRVLNHLAIYEDEEDTKKYYDGFHDPWRRWYCGLV
jgi:DNA ligase-4